MNLMQALRAGGGILNSNRRLLALYYAANVIFALVVVLPPAILLHADLGHSLESRRLFEHFDVSYLTTLLFRYQFALTGTTLSLLLSLLILSLIANTFLAGGAIAVFSRRDSGLFSGGARYFSRLFRVFLVCLIFYAAAAIIAALGLKLLGNNFKNSMEARPVVMTGWLWTTVCVLIFCFVNAAFDYAKIYCIANDSKRTWREMFRGMYFVSRNGTAAALYLATVLAAGIGFALYNAAADWLGQRTAVAVFALFVLRQLFVLARFLLRLTFFASAVQLIGNTQVESPREVMALSYSRTDYPETAF